MTAILIIAALSLSFGAGIWLGYRVGAVKPSGSSTLTIDHHHHRVMISDARLGQCRQLFQV